MGAPLLGRQVPVGAGRCRGLPYRTQVELAEELLTWLGPLLPPAMPLVVLADSLFDGQRLFTACRQRGWAFITKLKTNRTFADAPKTRVVACGKALAEGRFRRCRLCRGQGATAAYRRRGSRRPRAHETRAYGYHSERRRVSTLAEAQVVCSLEDARLHTAAADGPTPLRRPGHQQPGVAPPPGD